MAQKKIPFQDRISYLDEIQYEANTTPGVGNYNPRVFCILYSKEQKLRLALRRSLKTGGRSTYFRQRKNQRKVQKWEPTILNLQITTYLEAWQNQRQELWKTFWGKQKDSRLLPQDQDLILQNTQFFRSGKAKTTAKSTDTVSRHYLPKRQPRVSTIIDFRIAYIVINKTIKYHQ